MSVETGRLDAPEVRSMFDRIAPVYDVMNRVMTAGLDQHWRRETVKAVVRPRRPGPRRLLRHRRPGRGGVKAGAGEVIGLDFSPRMLERARVKHHDVTWIEGDLLAPCRSRTTASTRPPSASASATSPTFRRRARRARGACCARRPARDPRDHDADAESWRRSTGSGSTGSCRCSARLLKGGAAYTYLPASVRRFPGPGGARRADARGRVRARRLPDLRRRHRRAAHRGRQVTVLASIREAPGLESYLDELEERLAGDGGEPSGRRRCRRCRRARRRRQAAAADARLPRRRGRR